MEQKTKVKWLIISAVIAVIAFWIPSFARSMFQKGLIAENLSVTLVILSMPVPFLSAITAISFLIYLFVKKNK